MNAVIFETVVTDEHQLNCNLPASLPIELRRAYVESGGKLMTWDEINAEVREHRGGVADD